MAYGTISLNSIANCPVPDSQSCAIVCSKVKGAAEGLSAIYCCNPWIFGLYCVPWPLTASWCLIVPHPHALPKHTHMPLSAYWEAQVATTLSHVYCPVKANDRHDTIKESPAYLNLKSLWHKIFIYCFCTKVFKPSNEDSLLCIYQNRQQNISMLKIWKGRYLIVLQKLSLNNYCSTFVLYFADSKTLLNMIA